MDTSTQEREALAKRQAALVNSLLRQAAVPPGFDTARLQAAAESLGRKRARAVARAWPALVRALGDRFAALFADFAETTGLPVHGGALADGRAFAEYLAKLHELPPEGRLQALAIDLQFARCASGLKPRRGPALRIRWFSQQRAFFAGVRLPVFGVRWRLMKLFFWG